MRLIITYFAIIAAIYIVIPVALGAAAADKAEAEAALPTETASPSELDLANERSTQPASTPLHVEQLSA